MEEDFNSLELGEYVYIFGNDDEFIRNKLIELNDYRQLPLHDVKLNWYAASDNLQSIGRYRPRALFLLEIVSRAFSNGQNITQILSGAGFSDKLSAVGDMQKLLSHKFAHYSTEELKKEKSRAEQDIYIRKSEGSLKRARDARDGCIAFENLLLQVHGENQYWVKGHNGHNTQEHKYTWEVDIRDTGIKLKMSIQPDDNHSDDKYNFTIRIPVEKVEFALMESTDSMNLVEAIDDPSREPPLIPLVICFELWRGGKIYGETAFELPCTVEEATLSVIESGMRTCFPRLVSTFVPYTERKTEREPRPLTSDEDLRNYLRKNGVKLLFETTGIKADEIAGEHDVQQASYNPLVPFPQQQVARKILSKVCKVLTSHEDLKHLGKQFKRMEYLIMVPKYNTLKQQTKDRIIQHQNLVRTNEDVADFVELYSGNAVSNSPSERFQQSILNNDETLHVLVVDECHYAPTNTAIPILHAMDIRAKKNFVVLLVSATPYNCLSTNSSIPSNNIVDWSGTVSEIVRPNYVGFEHYFRSTAFRVPAEILKGIKVNNVHHVKLESLEHQEFGEFKHFAHVIADLIAAFKISCKFGEDKKFLLSLDKGVEIVEVSDLVKEGLLYHLGFRNSEGDSRGIVTVILSKVSKQIRATEPTSIDKKSSSTESQLIRTDVSLSGIRNAILADVACHDWETKAGKLSHEWCRLLPKSKKV